MLFPQAPLSEQSLCLHIYWSVPLLPAEMSTTVCGLLPYDQYSAVPSVSAENSFPWPPNLL